MMSYQKGEKANVFIFPDEKNYFGPIKIDTQGLSFCSENFMIESSARIISVLAYVKSGNGCIVTDRGKFDVSCGDVFILHKNDRHLYYTQKDSEWEFYWFNIAGDFFLELLSAYYLYDTYVINDTNMLGLFKDSFDYVIHSDDAIDDKHIKGVLNVYEILMRLSHIKNRVSKEIQPKTLMVKNYIDNNIYKKLTLKKLEQATGIPVHVITCDFKHDLKIAPYNYILMRKIDIAKSLLRTSYLSVKEISYMLSFADQYYFSNVFKKKTGFSPLAYRSKENGGGS